MDMSSHFDCRICGSWDIYRASFRNLSTSRKGSSTKNGNAMMSLLRGRSIAWIFSAARFALVVAAARRVDAGRAHTLGQGPSRVQWAARIRVSTWICSPVAKARRFLSQPFLRLRCNKYLLRTLTWHPLGSHAERLNLILNKCRPCSWMTVPPKHDPRPPCLFTITRKPSFCKFSCHEPENFLT